MEPVYRAVRLSGAGGPARGIGPLGALHTALLDAGREWVFLLPCDMPYFRTETVLELFAQADPDRDEACIFSAGRASVPHRGALFPAAAPGSGAADRLGGVPAAGSVCGAGLCGCFRQTALGNLSMSTPRGNTRRFLQYKKGHLLSAQTLKEVLF